MSDAAVGSGLAALARQAVEAYAQGRIEDAIGAAKRMLERSPEEASAHFLLGALHAEIGLIPRAIEEIGRAVALAPDLDAARFQLGLLELHREAADRAREIWAPLMQRDEDDAYAWFARGLIELSEGRPPQCIAALRRGLERNDFDAALSDQMARVLAVVEGGGAGPVPLAGTPRARPGADPSAVRRALLARYQVPDAAD